MSSDKRCVLAFTSMYIDPSGDIRPCCVSKNFPKPINLNDFDSIEDVMNNKQFQNLRKSMVMGQPQSMCDVCYTGGADLMDTWNKRWQHKLDDPDLYDKNMKVSSIHYLDARFSNICNFKCRMCHPSLSSSWYANYIEVHGDKGKKYLDSMKVLDDNAIAKFSDKAISKLEHMNVAGGEPFITADFFRLLDRISDIQAAKMTINVTTNLSTLFYKRKNVIDMLSRFKTVNIQASVDGYGDVGEYQRTGFSSQKFFNNLDMLTQMSKKYKHISVNLEYTITTLNMFHIYDFKDYVEANTPIRHSAINFHWAVGPLGFCPGIIPDDLKDKLTKYIDTKFGDLSENTKDNFRRFLQWVNKPSEEHLKVTYNDDGENMIKKLDKINKTNYKDLFPWLDDIFIYQKLLTKKLSVI